MADAATTSGWTPRGPWADILPAGQLGASGKPGIAIAPRERLGIASLIVSDGGHAALAQAVSSRFGLELPLTPRAVWSASHAVVWAGPGQWMLVAERRLGLADDLQSLSDVAAVADQSDGRAALRLSGPSVRSALAKGCMLDLHPRAFPTGAAALTQIGHVGVHFWRGADAPDGSVFEIMVARSMAGSFWSWLSASVAEFGCAVAAPGPS
ncbi:sarcosine oxidase subunit gamma [Chelatococcus sp. GCM10030263]|uniref:sarcosine oxidase subunit gamma n=1 Tax=Chelatococcus sp. GCM10030263 TaxID=3273387 RepID=UPI003612838D